MFCYKSVSSEPCLLRFNPKICQTIQACLRGVKSGDWTVFILNLASCDVGKKLALMPRIQEYILINFQINTQAVFRYS